MLKKCDFQVLDLNFFLEINFYQQNEGSVFLESNCNNQEEKFGEILLFCCVAIRTMVNFGKGHPLALELAANLAALSRGSFLSNSNLESYFDLTLINHSTLSGRKKFIGKLRLTKDQFNFKYHAKGFGLLGRGLGYYAPMAVLLFLSYLTRKRKDDFEFIEALKKAIALCAEAYVRNILNLKNQLTVAFEIASEACNIIDK